MSFYWTTRHSRFRYALSPSGCIPCIQQRVQVASLIDIQYAIGTLQDSLPIRPQMEAQNTQADISFENTTEAEDEFGARYFLAEDGEVSC